MVQPSWMAEAWAHLGAREVAGKRHNAKIVEFFNTVGRGEIKRDEVPWCAAFVGACLERAGITSTGSLLARSYLKWGVPVATPRFGAITVFTRGKDPGAGHVGFWLGETASDIILLGGNQSDAVTVGTYAKSRLLGYRMPVGFGAQSEVVGGGAAPRGAIFDQALEHVLKMEGGYVNDPDDPGGPTNKGVILEVFARHLGRKLTDATRTGLMHELRNIPDDVVKDIYEKRYWRPSRAGEMLPALALMHFDASVNHGVFGAAKLLQQALNRQRAGLDVDGEIGPLTMQAIAASDPAKLLAEYAAIRREKYRSLHHFWKFGRGWLNRVAKTLDQARPLLDTKTILETIRPDPDPDPDPNTTPDLSPKGNVMTTPNAATDEMSTPAPARPQKWWGESLTIWGALLTAATTVVPVVAAAFGIDLTPDLVRKVGEEVIIVVQALGGLVGTLMTIYGRSRAETKLNRRNIRLQL